MQGRRSIVEQDFRSHKMEVFARKCIPQADEIWLATFAASYHIRERKITQANFADSIHQHFARS
jgi:hypothetical protein